MGWGREHGPEPCAHPPWYEGLLRWQEAPRGTLRHVYDISIQKPLPTLPSPIPAKSGPPIWGEGECVGWRRGDVMIAGTPHHPPARALHTPFPLPARAGPPILRGVGVGWVGVGTVWVCVLAGRSVGAQVPVPLRSRVWARCALRRAPSTSTSGTSCTCSSSSATLRWPRYPAPRTPMKILDKQGPVRPPT